MFNKLADVIIKHPKAIVAVWILVLLGSVGVIMTNESSLQYDMTQMESGDSEAIIGMNIISDEFYQSQASGMGTIIAVEFGDYTEPESLTFFGALQTAVNAQYGTDAKLNMVLPFTADGLSIYSVSFLNDDIVTTDQVPVIRDIIKNTKDAVSMTPTTYVTGSDAISYDTEAGAMKDMEKIDPISILLILILIGLFFRSFAAAAAPPLAVGTAYGIMTMLIFFLGGIMDIFYISPIIMLVSMLGAGCDYCIFMLARYREERKGGKDQEQALRESVKWAGESISTSGLSVIIGFGVMSFCSFSMISTMGIVLALGIIVALLAALTLMPSVIRLIGDRIFAPSTVETYTEGSKAMNGWYGNWSRRGAKYFEGSARHAIKYAKPIVLAAVLVTVPLTYIMMTEETSFDMIATMPPGEAKDGMNIVVDELGGGVLMPTYVVMELDTPVAVIDTSAQTLTWTAAMPIYAPEMALMELDLMEMDNIMAVESLGLFFLLDGAYTLYFTTSGMTPADMAAFIDSVTTPMGITVPPATLNLIARQICTQAQMIMDMNPGAPLVDLENAYFYTAYTSGLISEDGKYVKMTVIMEDEPLSNLSMATIDDIRAFMDAAVTVFGTAFVVDYWVTGTTAVMYDISVLVNQEFMWIELGVIILIFLLLFFVMKSYLTPLRAILTILMSIAWTVGMTHILFGWLLDIPVLWIIPIVLLVICLGLGMDYDILLTTRIKENVTKGMTNDEAITHAIQKSGAVITICGLIMSGTFFTLTFSSSPMLQEFGFALGFAIMVDALIVRTYIVPAVMHLLGDWNWKGPKFMHKKKHVQEEAGSEEIVAEE